jgi:hypothetical protein
MQPLTVFSTPLEQKTPLSKEISAGPETLELDTFGGAGIRGLKNFRIGIAQV